MFRKASPTREETSKFQGRRRRKMEVPCSGVPLGCLARFCDGCRLWEINSRVRNQRMNRMEQVLLSWGMLAELLGMKCGPLCSSIFPKCLVKSQFRWQSGYQVLPPRRRWDICSGKLHQFGRRDPNLRFVGR